MTGNHTDSLHCTIPDTNICFLQLNNRALSAFTFRSRVFANGPFSIECSVFFCLVFFSMMLSGPVRKATCVSL